MSSKVELTETAAGNMVIMEVPASSEIVLFECWAGKCQHLPKPINIKLIFHWNRSLIFRYWFLWNQFWLEVSFQTVAPVVSNVNIYFSRTFFPVGVPGPPYNVALDPGVPSFACFCLGTLMMNVKCLSPVGLQTRFLYASPLWELEEMKGYYVGEGEWFTGM